jgi:hypothetical protein
MIGWTSKRQYRASPPVSVWPSIVSIFVGLTVTETAAVMKCAEGTVKSCLSDARAQLRVLLVDRA